MIRNTLLLKRALCAFFCVSLLFSFFSCDNLSELEQETVTPVSPFANRYAVTFSLEESLAKTVLPTSIAADKLSYLLKAHPTQSDADPALVAIDREGNDITEDFAKGFSYSTKAALDGACLYLDAGSWTFELNAYKSDSLVLTGTKVQSVGANNTPIVFTMTPATTGTGSIELSMHCYLGNDTSSTITAVSGTFYTTNGTTISEPWAQAGETEIAANDTSSGTTSYRLVTYTNNEVPKGTWLLKCTFTLSYDDDNDDTNAPQTILSSYPTVVTVEPGAMSAATVDISDLKQRYTVTYMNVNDDGTTEPFPTNYWVDKAAMVAAGKFSYNPSSKADFTLPKISEISRDTKCFVGWYTDYANGIYGDLATKIPLSTTAVTGEKTYYAKWRDLNLYVSATDENRTLSAGDDKGDGTIGSPYASLRKAIGFIQDYGGSALNWQIYIDGSVSGYSFSQIDEKAQSITVSGYTTDNVIADKLILPVSSTSTPSTGSVLTIESGVSITIENLTITGGSGSQGAGLDIKAGADVTLKNVTVTENSTHETNLQDGGGILNAGTLRLDGCIITGNTASRFGGGVYNSGTLYIYGKTVIGKSDAGNSAKAGGGIYNFGSGAVYIGYSVYTSASDNTPAAFTGSISHNTATGTTAVMNTADGSGGGAIFNQGTCIIAAGSDAAISNNSALYGAGVYNTTNSGSTPGVLSITGGTLSANPAGTNGNGGGIWSNGTLTVNGTTLSANTALSGNGGAIYVTGAATIGSEASPVTISGNTAQNGAGIYRDSTAVFTLSHVTLSGNNASATGDTAASGGAIYNAAGNSTLTACTLIGNTATTSGGGIYNASGELTLSGGTIGAEKGANSAGLGGGVYNAGTLSVEGASICYNGTNETITTTSGGGIYNSGTLTVTGTDAAISHNTATSGAGVYCVGTSDSNRASFTMSAGTVGSNTAVNGAGVYNGAHSTFTMSGGSIASNTANPSGGGVYNAGSMFMYGSAVVGDASAGSASNSTNSNSAASGGGVYNAGGLYLGYTDADTPAKLTGGVYSNYAANGGGLYNDASGKTYFAYGVIANNAAATSGYGGGVYNSGEVYMHTSAVIGNASADTYATDSDYSNTAGRGGGVYNVNKFYLGYSSATVETALYGGIYYNMSSNGGGIFNGSESSSSTAELCIGSGNVAYNFAKGPSSENAGGGGVWHQNGNFKFSGGTIYSNQAKGYGGGVNNQGNMYVYGSALIGDREVSQEATESTCSNKAKYGGGVYNNGTLKLGYKGDSEEDEVELTKGIYYNYASDSETGGGGVFNAKTFNMKTGYILYNFAKQTEDEHGKKGYYTGTSATTTIANSIKDDPNHIQQD